MFLFLLRHVTAIHCMYEWTKSYSFNRILVRDLEIYKNKGGIIIIRDTLVTYKTEETCNYFKFYMYK